VRREAVRPGWAVVCDFDGTATLEDLADGLSRTFASEERWRQAESEFQAGAISFEDLLRRIFEPIRATPEEIRDYVWTHGAFRPGFERLLRLCRERAIPFALVSGGLDLYISPALERLPEDLRRGLEVRANHAEHTPTGLRITFPWKGAPGSCGRCGSCKGAVVKGLQAKGHRVLAVGDGNADRCSARVADAVFARARLLDWCRRTGLPCRPFESLDEVADWIAALGVR